MKILKLNKEIISRLSDESLRNLVGGCYLNEKANQNQGMNISKGQICTGVKTNNPNSVQATLVATVCFSCA